MPFRGCECLQIRESLTPIFLQLIWDYSVIFLFFALSRVREGQIGVDK